MTKFQVFQVGWGPCLNVLGLHQSTTLTICQKTKTKKDFFFFFLLMFGLAPIYDFYHLPENKCLPSMNSGKHSKPAQSEVVAVGFVKRTGFVLYVSGHVKMQVQNNGKKTGLQNQLPDQPKNWKKVCHWLGCKFWAYYVKVVCRLSNIPLSKTPYLFVVSLQWLNYVFTSVILKMYFLYDNYHFWSFLVVIVHKKL